MKELYGKLVCFIISIGLVAGCDMVEKTSKREKKRCVRNDRRMHTDRR